MALSSNPVSLPKKVHNHDDVPYLDEDLVESFIVRLILATIAGHLAKMPVSEHLPLAVELRRDRKLGARLDSLRQALAYQCILGQSNEVAGLVSSAASWARFLEEKVWGVPWLCNTEALHLARDLFASLWRYLQPRPEQENRANPLLREIRDAFVELRSGFLPTWSSCLLVRHWMTAEERRRARHHELVGRPSGDPDYFSTPWRCTPQPSHQADRLDRIRSGELAAPESLQPTAVLFQRGQVQARSEEVQMGWAEAVASFYGRLVPLVPLWRSELLERARWMENPAQDSAASAGPAGTHREG